MILIISDLHFGCKMFNKIVFERQINFYKNQLFPYILKNNIKNVICLGDVFHNRNSVDIYILKEVKEKFFEFFIKNNINLHIILGNHDIYFKDRLDVNLLQTLFPKHKNIIVYDTIEIKNIDKYKFCFIPWVINLEMIDKLIPKNIDILLGHFEIKNIKLNNNFYSVEGIEKDFFKDFKLVFSGHFHSNIEEEKIIYIGSPYQLNWGDFGNRNGFYVLKDNFQFEFIENTISPKYLKIYFLEDEDWSFKVLGLKKDFIFLKKDNLKDIIKRNYCKIIIEDIKKENEEIFYNYLDELQKESLEKIEVINLKEIIEETNSISIEFKEENKYDVVLSYIDLMPLENKKINKEILKQKFIQLYNECEDKFLKDII